MSQQELQSHFDQFSSNDRKARERARAALVEAGIEALELLTQGLESSSRQIQWESAKALFSIGDPSVADALARTLEDDDLDVRWVCAEALVKLGQPGIMAVLRRLTQSSDMNLQQTADMVLSRFIAPRHIALQPVLDALRAGEPGEKVMVAAGEALGKLTLEG